MALVQIKTFLAIVETGSLVRASQMLNVTQSTVTARLKNLEEDLGQRLIHRHKSGIQLTSSGVKFKRYADAMNNMWRLARLETSLPDDIDTICNLGCEIDLWPGIARKLTTTVRRDHRTTAMNIRPLDPFQIEAWLGSNLIDAALCYTPVAAEDARVFEMGEETLRLYTSDPDAPLIRNPDYVYVDAGEKFGREHAEAYAEADVARNSFGCAAWGLDHICDVGGSIYLPQEMAKPHLADGTLHEVADAPSFTRNIFFVSNILSLQSWPWLPDLLSNLLAIPAES